MSSTTGILHENFTQVSPGDYEFNVTLYSHNPHSNFEHGARPITLFVTEINISEGIDQGSLIAKLTIRDGVNLLEDMRISGGERIQIQITQKEPLKGNAMKKHTMDHTFYISDIMNYSRSLGIQTYELQLVSRLAYLNQGKGATHLKGAFNGSRGKCIFKLVDKVYSGNKFIDEGGGNVQGIYVHKREIDAINWLKRNAFDDGTPYYFFESLNYNTGGEEKGGIVFTSLAKFIQNHENDDLLTYSQTPYGQSTGDPVKSFQNSQYTILHMSTNLGLSKFNQIRKGAYSSKLTTVDISTKQVKENIFEYNNENKLNQYKPFATTDKAKELYNKEFGKVEGRRFYSSINSQSFANNTSYHKPLEDSNELLKVMATSNNLNYMSHEITVYGNSNIFPGKLILLKVPKSAPAENVDHKDLDELQSGIYLIKRINHILKGNVYTMKVLIAKESSMLDLDLKTPDPKEGVKE